MSESDNTERQDARDAAPCCAWWKQMYTNRNLLAGMPITIRFCSKEKDEMGKEKEEGRKIDLGKSAEALRRAAEEFSNRPSNKNKNKSGTP